MYCYSNVYSKICFVFRQLYHQLSSRLCLGLDYDIHIQFLYVCLLRFMTKLYHLRWCFTGLIKLKSLVCIGSDQWLASTKNSFLHISWNSRWGSIMHDHTQSVQLIQSVSCWLEYYIKSNHIMKTLLYSENEASSILVLGNSWGGGQFTLQSLYPQRKISPHTG
jgi:hypothetical protein